MDFLIRDLSDGSFAGVVRNLPKKPRCPEGFEATVVTVIEDHGDFVAVNDDSTKVSLSGGWGLVHEGFIPAFDTSVWRDFNSYQEWKEEMSG